MKVIVHQPEYLPYIGFWNRLLQADIYVLLDTATFQKHGFIHRNKIKTPQGEQWMTVPLQAKSSFTKIKDLHIDNSKDWRKSHIGMLQQNYKNAPYAADVMPIVQKVLETQTENLLELSEQFFFGVAHFLGIQKKTVKASDLQAQGKATDLLVAICKEVEADTYISGPAKRAGKEAYMENEKFEKAGIVVQAHEFVHPEYTQQYMEQGFVPYMCILDLLFNEGPRSKDVIK